MAKKVLTTEQKIKKINAKRKRKVILSIVIPLVGLLIAIPLFYQAYFYVAYTVLPARAGDSYKVHGAGYSRPLRMIEREDTPNWSCTVAYYYDGCWNVIDDTEAIMENQNNFLIYKTDDEWHEGTHLQLFIIEKRYMYHHISLSEFSLIDDRCFKDCKKQMTMEKFKQYCKERDFQNVYIY